MSRCAEFLGDRQYPRDRTRGGEKLVTSCIDLRVRLDRTIVVQILILVVVVTGGIALV